MSLNKHTTFGAPAAQASGKAKAMSLFQDPPDLAQLVTLQPRATIARRQLDRLPVTGLRSEKKIRKRYLCPWPGCKWKFHSRATLEIHICHHSGDSPHACRWEGCGKTFRSRHSQLAHERAHMPPTSNMCRICGQRFHKPKHRKTHMLIEHVGYCTNSCRYNCGFRAELRCHVLSHEKRHHAHGPGLRCPDCDFLAPTQDALEGHQREHQPFNNPRLQIRLRPDGSVRLRNYVRHLPQQDSCGQPASERARQSSDGGDDAASGSLAS